MISIFRSIQHVYVGGMGEHLLLSLLSSKGEGERRKRRREEDITGIRYGNLSTSKQIRKIYDMNDVKNARSAPLPISSDAIALPLPHHPSPSPSPDPF